MSDAAFYVGLMSGTSLDGVDAVLMEFASEDSRCVPTLYRPYPEDLRAEVLALSTPGQPNELHRAGVLSNRLADAYAAAVLDLLGQAEVSAESGGRHRLPKDIAIAEVHDCYTISEIMEYEAFGWCERGKGGIFIEGQSYIGGKIAVNPRGGLLGCGHPLGATAILQAIDIMQQFRGEVPKGRHVQDAELAVAHNLSGPANVHSILVYSR